MWTRDELQQLLDTHGTFNAIARAEGMPATTVRSRASALGVKKPAHIVSNKIRTGLTMSGDTATIVSEPALELGDIAEMIRARGLDPDEWEVKNAVLNCWDANAGAGEIIELRQLKIHLVRRVPIEFILPVTDVKPRTPRKPVKSESRTIILLPDQHAPYEDKACHEAVLAMLAHVQPDEVGLLGDLVDLPTISKHRDNPAWSASVSDCVQGGFELLRDYTEATPSRFWMLKGNHCFRLETELLARAERMYGIAPASIDGEEQDQALSLKRLLHLDRLEVELIEPPRRGDGYEMAVHQITEKFEARHGWITGQNSAQKALIALAVRLLSAIRTDKYSRAEPTLTGWVTGQSKPPNAGRSEALRAAAASPSTRTGRGASQWLKSSTAQRQSTSPALTTGYSGGAVKGTNEGAESKIARLLQFNGNPGAKVVRVTFEGEACVALFTVPHEGRRIGMTAFITAASDDRIPPDIDIRKGFV